MQHLLSVLVLTTSTATTGGTNAGRSQADASLYSLVTTIDGLQASETKPQETAPRDTAKDGVDLRAYWKDGFRLESADKAFSMRISGRLQSDWAWFHGDENEFEGGNGPNPVPPSTAPSPNVGELNDGSEIRRAYLGFDGKLFSEWEYKLEWDLVRADNGFADSYLATQTGIGNVKVGHYKQPISLEEVTSDLHTTFMERSLSGAFKLGRDVGLQLSDTCASEAVTWAAGVFRDTDANGKDSSKTSDDEYAFTGRTTWAPLYAGQGRTLVHVGTSLSYRNPMTDRVAFQAKPEANLAPNFLDTLSTTGANGAGLIVADDYRLAGAEAAAVFGPFSVQSEFMQANIAGMSTAGGTHDPKLWGYYVYASVFLTGEHRAYKRATGVFDRVKPKSNYGPKSGGHGAWELGLRYTYLDFSEAVAGTQNLSDVTAGVNWYMNAFTKIQANVVKADLERGAIDEEATIFEVRFQFDL